MRLTWVSGCAMVHAGDEPGPGMTALVANASGVAELPVVITSHTLRLLPAMMNELADALAERMPQHRTRIRLVAWNSGCLHDDRPAPAYQLATRLGVEVIAPAGPLLGVPGGSLFAPAGRGAQRPGGWWRFAAGAGPTRVGWRYPAPTWDAELGDVADLGHDLVLEHVPAGLWLHRSGYRSVTDLVYSVPLDPSDPALIVSHPTEAPLHRDDVARALDSLPRRTAERLIFTPYGPTPVRGGCLGDVAATVLRAPVRVRAGLPLFAAGGKRALVTVDSGGRPCWRPFVRESRYHPKDTPAEATDWTNPVPAVLGASAGPAAFTLGTAWAAEVIEAGLWIRPAQPTDTTDRSLPLDVDECTVVLGTPPAGYPAPPLPLISDLLRHLPADARSRVRLAVHGNAEDDLLAFAASLCEELPGAPGLRVLHPGRRPAAARPAGHAPSRPADEDGRHQADTGSATDVTGQQPVYRAPSALPAHQPGFAASVSQPGFARAAPQPGFAPVAQQPGFASVAQQSGPPSTYPPSTYPPSAYPSAPRVAAAAHPVPTYPAAAHPAQHASPPASHAALSGGPVSRPAQPAPPPPGHLPGPS
ncbi:MAG: hypothetical protein QOE03_715, partial [Micromonosporaceae bacterium]|nr:hypothetical protein [Micromonosporaceae bacterium]